MAAMIDTERIKMLLQENDFFWTDKEDLPKHWFEGAFHGNGRLGSAVYFEEIEKEKYIHVELCCNEVYDRREGEPNQFNSPRLPIGFLLYKCSGDVMDVQMHTDLYRAMTELRVTTDRETINCNFYVCAESQLIVIEQREGDIKKWRFVPEKAISPRQTYGIERQEVFRIDKNYKGNSNPTVTEMEKEIVCIQDLENDYHTVTIGKREEKCLFFTIRQGQNLTAEDVKDELCSEMKKNYRKEHLTWWEDYYAISGIEVPDSSVEQFYWRQVYKLGSAVREDSIVLDNQGPWLFTTPWPGTWWNLNVQLSYWPLYTANRLGQANSLNKHLLKYSQDLIENVPKKYQYDSAGLGTATTWNLKAKVADPMWDGEMQFVELGNLTWTLHNCWLYYRMTMDHNLLKELIYPLLTRAVNYYLHFLKKENGRWHLPPTDSPEYGKRCEDCNYDLALLKWGCSTLLQCTRILGIENEKENIWKDVCENLADYAIDDTGYMIGKDLPYRKSHRHFSHLMMHIPLYLVNRENSDSWKLVKRSIENWFSYPEDIRGFSDVGASLLCSAYRKGNRALGYIRELLEKHITINSMYLEAGPVIETPLAGMECIQQLLLQSWGEKVRVFPAMPSEWKDASFWKLAAQGGFVVSASYKNGKTEWIQMESLTDTVCTVETDMEKAEILFEDQEAQKIEIRGEYIFKIKAGECVLIRKQDM